MHENNELARAPEEETPVRRPRNASSPLRRWGKVAILPLVLALACSRAIAPQAESGSHPTRHSEGGTGTRAKGEASPMAEAPALAAPKQRAAAPMKAQASARSLGLLGVGRGARDKALPSEPLVVAGPRDDFNTEGYQRVQENPFFSVKDSPLSTFSVDVDTASYSNMRRFVQNGTTPPADSIRVEEWINYFSYDDALPERDEPIALSSELTDCPWASSHRLLRVALATRPLAQDAVPSRNLVFLIDVSGSMQPANKLPLLKQGLAMLARQLRPQDTVSMVVYAGASGLALSPTSGGEQDRILGALGTLESGGSTNGAEGIELAYRVAASQFKQGGINRVILASDGDFNVGITSEGALERLIEEKR